MAKKMSKLPLNEILGVVGGSIAANLVKTAIDKAMPTGSPLVKSLIPVGLGVFLSTQKNALIKGAGLGMLATGSGSLVAALLPKTGARMQGVEELFALNGEEDFMGEPADQSILSLPADQSVLSAMDEDGISADEMSILSAMDEE